MSPLANLFLAIVSIAVTRYLPDDWLRSYTPLFKKELSFGPNNYRPVALTKELGRCRFLSQLRLSVMFKVGSIFRFVRNRHFRLFFGF